MPAKRHSVSAHKTGRENSALLTSTNASTTLVRQELAVITSMAATSALAQLATKATELKKELAALTSMNANLELTTADHQASAQTTRADSSAPARLDSPEIHQLSNADNPMSARLALTLLVSSTSSAINFSSTPMEAHDMKLSVESTDRLLTETSLMLTKLSDTHFHHQEPVLILTMPVSSSASQDRWCPRHPFRKLTAAVQRELIASTAPRELLWNQTRTSSDVTDATLSMVFPSQIARSKARKWSNAMLNAQVAARRSPWSVIRRRASSAGAQTCQNAK